MAFLCVCVCVCTCVRVRFKSQGQTGLYWNGTHIFFHEMIRRKHQSTFHSPTPNSFQKSGEKGKGRGEEIGKEKGKETKLKERK